MVLLDKLEAEGAPLLEDMRASARVMLDPRETWRSPFVLPLLPSYKRCCKILRKHGGSVIRDITVRQALDKRDGRHHHLVRVVLDANRLFGLSHTEYTVANRGIWRMLPQQALVLSELVGRHAGRALREAAFEDWHARRLVDELSRTMQRSLAYGNRSEYRDNVPRATGRTNTVEALRRRELVDQLGKLTPLGEQVRGVILRGGETWLGREWWGLAEVMGDLSECPRPWHAWR